MKKILCMVMALCLALAGLTAVADDTIELSFTRIGSDPAERAYWDWVIEHFEAENPGIRIMYDEVAIGDSIDNKLNVQFSAGDGPDLIGHGILSVAQRVELGHYQPIDEYFETWEGKDDIMPSVLANGTYKGHVYGLAYSTTPYVFAYRSDLLEAANLSVPTTWDELAETARALTQKNEKGEITFSGFCFPSAGGNLVELDVFVYGNGGSYLAEDGSPLMTGAEKEEAINFLNGLLPDVNIPYSNSETNPFAQGLAAMTLINNAALTSILNNPDYEGKVGVAVPPHNTTEGTFCGCNMLFIGRDCADKDAAWKFIEFAMSKESTLKRSEMVKIPVTRQSLVEDYQAMDPWNAVRAECVAVGTGMPRTTWSTLFQKIRNELVQNVVLGNVTDAAAALEKAQDDLLFEIDG